MSQPITTSVTMDAESFQKFRSFDLFHHQKRWQRPLLFAAILLGSSGICLSQVGVREGASLLAVVLAMWRWGSRQCTFTPSSGTCAPPSRSWASLGPSTASGWTMQAFPSGWPENRTSPSPATSTRGRTFTWPTAPRTPCTFTSSRPKPTSSTARSGTRCGTA